MKMRKRKIMQTRCKMYCYFTGYTAKRKYMQSKGIMIDVWIDDMPMLIDSDLNGN